MTFADHLKKWRERLGLSQGDVDRAIGKNSRGYVAQIETRRLKPPSLEECRRIAEIVGMDVGEVWSIAAPERMHAFDPELLNWHNAIVSSLAGLDVTALAFERRELLEENERLRAKLAVLRQHVLDITDGL